MPEYLNNPEYYEKGYHVENVGDGGNFYWVTSPAGYEAGFVVTGAGVVVIDAPPDSARTCRPRSAPSPTSRSPT